MSEDRRLVKLTEAQKALQEAKTIPEIKNIIDRAEAIRHFVKQQGYALDIQNDATEISLRAQRKAGLLLCEMKEVGELQHGGDRKSASRFHSATLKDLGVNRTQSFRWQLQSSVPEETFERLVGEIRAQGERLTSATILREAQRLKRPTFDDPPPMPTGEYDLIYADPPWRYEHIATESFANENHYPTLPTDDICALEVPSATDALLYLWTTNPKLTDALQVIEAWGFTYRTNMVWVKHRRGMGYYAHSRHELLLIATKGRPKPPAKALRPDSVIEHPRQRHSEKPPLHSLLDTLYPNLRKLELFARSQRPEYPLWDFWGNEILVSKAG